MIQDDEACQKAFCEEYHVLDSEWDQPIITAAFNHYSSGWQAALDYARDGQGWRDFSISPEHEQDILIETETGDVLVGFYIDPEKSDSMLTGYCYWPPRGSHAVGLLCQYWKPLNKRIQP